MSYISVLVHVITFLVNPNQNHNLGLGRLGLGRLGLGRLGLGRLGPGRLGLGRLGLGQGDSVRVIGLGSGVWFRVRVKKGVGITVRFSFFILVADPKSADRNFIHCKTLDGSA